jgi:hypothetical protein
MYQRIQNTFQKRRNKNCLLPIFWVAAKFFEQQEQRQNSHGASYVRRRGAELVLDV